MKTRKFRNEAQGWTEWKRKSRLQVEGRRVTVETTVTKFDEEDTKVFIHVDFWTGGRKEDACWKNPVAAFREISSYIMKLYEEGMRRGYVCFIVSSTPSRQALYERVLKRKGLSYRLADPDESWGTRPIVWNE